MIARIWQQAGDFWSDGGMVMPALFLTAFLLWFAIAERWLALHRGDARAVRELARLGRAGAPLSPRGLVSAAAARGARLWRERGGAVPMDLLHEAFADLEAQLGTGARFVGCLVAMAPLMGLLGTVVGLIETFGSLGASAASAASEGIAGGIVEALYATQMGLAIAVPGLLVGGALHQRQASLRRDLDSLKAIFAGAERGAA
jgi:biopolymer transport protein ExbB